MLDSWHSLKKNEQTDFDYQMLNKMARNLKKGKFTKFEFPQLLL